MNVIKNGIIGFAIGDAIGVPIEFENREYLDLHLIDKMLGYGSHNVPAGNWSDDTSLVLATMDAIINDKKIVYETIADNFVLWMTAGKYSSTAKAFGGGRTTLKALYKYKLKRKDAIKCGSDSFGENGNGSLMRILPLAYYFYYKDSNDKEILRITKNISSITHAHQISIMACYIYVMFIINILKGNSKEEAYKKICDLDYSMFEKENIEYFDRILGGKIDKEKRDSIKSSGFVIDTLEAVFWSILTTDSYYDSVVEAINLGNDTDTIGALTGGASGIIYGIDNIPVGWIGSMQCMNYLYEMSLNYEMVLNQL